MTRYLIALLIALSSFANAQGTRVSDETAASTPLTGTELVYCVQSGADRKCTTQDIADLKVAVTSITAGCNTTASASTGAVAIAAQVTPSVQTGANYAFQSTDCGKQTYLSNASNQIPTIAQAGTTGFETGKFFDVCNIGAGTQTITPTTSTIGGAATYVLAAGTSAAPQCVRIISDGTNYRVSFVPGSGGGSTTITDGVTATSGITSGNFISSTSNLAKDSGKAVPSGAVVGTTDTQTLTNKTISGSNNTISNIGNSSLTNSSTTVNGTTCTLGSTCTVTGADLGSYVTNDWHVMQTPMGVGASGAAVTLDTIYCSMGSIGGSVTIKALGAYLTGAGAGNAQWAVYQLTANDTLTLVTNAFTGNVDVSGAAGFKSGTLNSGATPTLTAGTYAFCSNHSATNPTFYGWTAGSQGSGQGYFFGSSTGANVVGHNNLNGKSKAQTFGTWPSSITISTMSDLTSIRSSVVAFQVN